MHLQILEFFGFVLNNGFKRNTDSFVIVFWFFNRVVFKKLFSKNILTMFFESRVE